MTPGSISPTSVGGTLAIRLPIPIQKFVADLRGQSLRRDGQGAAFAEVLTILLLLQLLVSEARELAGRTWQAGVLA